MRTWLLILGGPLLWSMHFGLAYLIASISVVASGETTLVARALVAGAGAVAALAALWLLRESLAIRDGELASFTKIAGTTGAVIGAAGIIWTSLSALAPI